MRRTWRGRLLVCLLPLLVVACGGGGGGGDDRPPSSSVAGVASKGPIQNGTVNVYALDAAGTKGDLLGTATTADDGTYEVALGRYAGNVLVEVTGGTYRDEATGAEDVPNPGLKAALSGVSGDVTVAVTPLTDLAVQHASELTGENIDKANSLVSSMVGLDIIGTDPVDVSAEGAASSATQDQIDYGLALAALSSMSQEGSVGETITQLKDDLADGMLQDTGAPFLAALDDFLASERNMSGVSSAETVPLGSAIAYIAEHEITPPADASDLNKAKAMVSDFRNTILSVYNYKGVGAPGILETPLQNFSQELQYEVTPELAGAVDRIGWIVAAAQAVDPTVAGTLTDVIDGETLTIDVVAGQSVTFSITDGTAATVASGTLGVTPNGNAVPITGSLDATFDTPNGEMVVAVDYAGAVSSETGAVTRVTLTGTITAPGLELDFAEGGRKLNATFARHPGATDPLDIYPTGVLASALLKTQTGQVEGALELSSFVLNPVSRDSLPKRAELSGSFEELQAGQPTGVRCEGSIVASWTNAATYDMDAEDSPTNFPRWSATFLGKIVAPSRPTIDAFLKVSQSAFGELDLEAKYTRTNVDGSKVFISGAGTLDTETGVLTAELTNQQGLKIALTFDDSLAREDQLTGTIETSGGEKLADLGSNMKGIPTVKYIDNYFESLI